MDQSKETKELFNELLFCSDINCFIEANAVELKDLTLVDYLQELLLQKNMKKNDVINASRLNTTYAYQIFSGQRKPSRDKLLQLIFGLELEIHEAQRLLRLAGVSELYAKNKRDSIILFCVNKKVDVYTADDLLYKYKQIPIINDNNDK